MVNFYPYFGAASAKIGTCYNSQVALPSPTSGDCGITLVEHTLGKVTLDLGFELSDRIVLVTPYFELKPIVASVDKFGETVTVHSLYTNTDFVTPTNVEFDLVIL